MNILGINCIAICNYAAKLQKIVELRKFFLHFCEKLCRKRGLKGGSGFIGRTRAAEKEGAERLKRKCVTRTSYINVTQERASGGREQRAAERKSGSGGGGGQQSGSGGRGQRAAERKSGSRGRRLYGLSGVQRSLAISFPAMKRQRSELCGMGE